MRVSPSSLSPQLVTRTHGPGSHAAASHFSFDPVADLGLAVVDLEQPTGTQEVARRHLEHDHRRRGAAQPCLGRGGDPAGGMVQFVGGGNPRKAGDLEILAGGEDGRGIVLDRWPELDDAIVEARDGYRRHGNHNAVPGAKRPANCW